MAYKAKAVSDLIQTWAVSPPGGGVGFRVEMRRLTPKHYAVLREQSSDPVINPQTGMEDKRLNDERFAAAIFEAAVLRALDLTPEVAATFIELDAGSDQPAVDESGCITDRAFLKFLWDEVPGVASQILRANDRMLTAAKAAREIDRGNSESSSAA